MASKPASTLIAIAIDGLARNAATHATAFDGALDTLDQRLVQERRQTREAGRRPKKHVAKRALSGRSPRPGREREP